MANFENQKSQKLKIEELAPKKLDGEFLKDFNDFLDFLKREKISAPWKSINGFKMKYKGEGVGGISFLGEGGWADGIVEAKNHIHIGVDTIGYRKDGFDLYLDGQSDEIKKMLMERLSYLCIHCRPTCGCSQVSGRNAAAAGKMYEKVCANMTGYGFSGDNMRELTLFSPRASFTPEPVGKYPIETVKKLILARKAYIDKL